MHFGKLRYLITMIPHALLAGIFKAANPEVRFISVNID